MEKSSKELLGEGPLAFIPSELAQMLEAFVSSLQSGNGQIILNLHRREKDGKTMVETCTYQEHWRRPKDSDAFKDMISSLSKGVMTAAEARGELGP